jgi:hypothetical protein
MSAQRRLFDTDDNPLSTSTPPSTPPSTKRRALMSMSVSAPEKSMEGKRQDDQQHVDDEENAVRPAYLFDTLVFVLIGVGLGAFAVCMLVSVVVSHLQTLMGAGILSLSIVPVFARMNPLTTSFVCALLLTAFAYTVEWASLNNRI